MKRGFCFLFAFVIFISCKDKHMDQGDSGVFYVKVEKVTKRDLREEIVVFGDIKAKDEVIIYPRISGKLVKNLVKEGDYVGRDDAVALVKKDEVGSLYEPAPVPSTISGYVGRIYQDEGADVSPLTPIAMVVDQSYMRIQCSIPERYVSQIKINQKIYFKTDVYKERVFYGKVDKITPVIDKISRTFQIESLLDNKDGLLKSGMTAEVHIILNEVKSVPAVPVSALIYRKNVPYLYLADRKNAVAVEKEAVIGFVSTDYVWVKNLREGDEVIVLGMEGLKDGFRIKIIE